MNSTDFDEYFDRDQIFYQGFGERLTANMPQSTYTHSYLRKLNYYANESNDSFPNSVYLLLLGMGVCIGLLSLWIIRLKQQLKSKSFQINSEIKAATLAKQLTRKEKEILKLISLGKSNKEIASELFVELSTVKTHINKIYSKLNVKNREEAAAIGSNEY